MTSLITKNGLSMNMLSAMLFVFALMLPAQSLSRGQYDYDDHDALASAHLVVREINQPTNIPFINIDLQPESVAYIKKWAKITAGMGALLGGCMVSSNLQSHYAPLEKIGLLIVGSAISGCITSFIGSMIATLQTDEKRYEHTINSLIQLNNDAYNLYTKIDLDQNQRNALSSLLAQDFYLPQNRAAVYRYVYPLAQKNSSLFGQCLIATIVDYLDGLAHALERELDMAGKMVTQIPSESNVVLPSAKQDQIADVIETITINQQALFHLNGFLSPQLIRQWTDQMRNMPEYNIEQLRTELAKEYAALEKYENDIRYKLARLSALHGKVFSRAYLTQTFGEYLWHSFVTDYPNTPEGRRARLADIAYTKNDISSAIQSYQSRACSYSNKVITFNAKLNLVSPDIQYVIQRNGTELRQLSGYQLNAKLLEYNIYLNHNDGDALWTWVQSCF